MLGKLDAELPKMRMNLECLQYHQRRAAETHMSLAERIRMLLDIDYAGGLERYNSLQAERNSRVVGKGGAL